jgi:hypothetical protein
MARLTFPDRQALTGSLTDGAPATQQDAYATAERSGDTLTVRLNDGTVGLTLTYSPGRWSVRPGNAPLAEPVVIPEPLLARANRLMQAEGVSLQRDWRTKTHVLRAAQRRTLPLSWGDEAVAVLTATGWVAAPGGAAPQPVAPVAPVAPPASPQPAPTEGETLPAQAEPMPALGATTPSLPRTMPLSGIPAAYSGTIVLSKQARAKWHAARAAHRAGEPMVIAMVGPSGAGKTHAVHALAAEESLDVVKFDASGVIEPGDWFGTVVLDGNGTRFVPSDLLVALTLPGPRVLLVDEANRANMRALNAMLPVLDGSGTVTIPQSGKRERVNREVQVVLTANMGTQFLATEPLDEAIRTRVGQWIEVDHLAEAQERDLLQARVPGLTDYDAANLARLGVVLREAAQNGQHAPVSTRQLLSAARLIVLGNLSPRLAVDAAVVDGYSPEGGGSSERAKVKVHVGGIQWRQPKPGAVYTGTDTCKCGHTGDLHGIGAEVSVSTHCRTCARDWPNNPSRQCMAFGPVMSEADPSADDELTGY